METKICERCKKEIDINAKQCPYCHKWVWKKGNKKVVKTLGIFAGILFAIFVLLIIIVTVGNGNEEFNCSKADFITVDKLYNELSNNKVKAKELYNDKLYKIVGYTNKISDTILLGDTETPVYSIEIYFNDSEKEKIVNLNKGDKITVCGKVRINEPVIAGFTTWDMKNATIIENR